MAEKASSVFSPLFPPDLHPAEVLAWVRARARTRAGYTSFEASRLKVPRLRGVIFDLDGLLVMSEPPLAEAAVALFAEKGHTVNADDFKPFIGMGEDRYIGGVAEIRGIKLDVDRDKARQYEIYARVIRGRL